MDKKEFAQLVKDIRATESSLGTVSFQLTEKMKRARLSGRSLYVARDIKAGEEITRENVRSVRPGYGLPPKFLPQLIGKKVNRDLEMGIPMSFDFIKD